MLSLTPRSIQAQIIGTLRSMARIYADPPRDKIKADSIGWSDALGPQGLISTGEALECLFIPYLTVPKIQELFWAGELLPLDTVTRSIEYLTFGYRTEIDTAVDSPLELSGTPYIDFRRVRDLKGQPSGLKRNFDFLDTACFVLCALLDAKTVQAHGELLSSTSATPLPRLYPERLSSQIDARIMSCLKLLKACDVGPGQGWTFTNDEDEREKTDFLYFTWNALEAIEVIVSAAELDLLPAAVTEITGDKIRSLITKTSYRPSLPASPCDTSRPRMPAVPPS